MTQDKQEAEAGQKEGGCPGGPGHRPAAPGHDDHGGPHGAPVPLLGQDDVLVRPHSGAGQEWRPSRLKHILVVLFLFVSAALAVFIIVVINVVPGLSSWAGSLTNIAVLVIKALGVAVAAAVVSRVVGIF